MTKFARRRAADRARPCRSIINSLAVVIVLA
jgi:hypothetical protein